MLGKIASVVDAEKKDGGRGKIDVGTDCWTEFKRTYKCTRRNKRDSIQQTSILSGGDRNDVSGTRRGGGGVGGCMCCGRSEHSEHRGVIGK